MEGEAPPPGRAGMTKTLDDFTGAYGPDWRTGVLTDHVGAAEAAGMKVHAPRHGKATYVTGPAGGTSVPVLCGEIIEIATEDGPIDGRCGRDVRPGEFGCPGHHEMILSYSTSRYDYLYEWETADA